MPSFETVQPIAVSIDVTHSMGMVNVIASDRSDTVVAVNPRDRNRQVDVETAKQTVVDLNGGSLTIRAPRRTRHRCVSGDGSERLPRCDR